MAAATGLGLRTLCRCERGMSPLWAPATVCSLYAAFSHSRVLHERSMPPPCVRCAEVACPSRNYGSVCRHTTDAYRLQLRLPVLARFCSRPIFAVVRGAGRVLLQSERGPGWLVLVRHHGPEHRPPATTMARVHHPAQRQLSVRPTRLTGSYADQTGSVWVCSCDQVLVEWCLGVQVVARQVHMIVGVLATTCHKAWTAAGAIVH